jgi:hypothetical protein
VVRSRIGHAASAFDVPLGSTIAPVRCVFCAAANVMGLDLRADAAQASARATSLEDALVARERECHRWRWMTLASIPLFVLTALILRRLA